ncbi:hypothetical protein EIP86_010624 [Pleurotus ostreatoroseus]|nr:hypothetical protein EIP86_010624 [Pleurotus ostreatoroseus]
MCRWFAYLSNTEPCLLEDVLILPKHSLAKQVHEHYLPGLTHFEPDVDRNATEKEIALRNRLFNSDGLGVAWYTTTREEFGECAGPRPVLYKIVRQPLTDPVFQSICAHTSALAVFAHIRAASGSTAITTSNNHPFNFGRWCFMHNGQVAHFDMSQVRKELVHAVSDEAHNLVKGTTDSEHLAALFFTFMEEKQGAQAWERSHPLEEVKLALEKAVAKIIQIQRRALHPAQPDASSLNVAITDGEQLLAMRFRNHPTEHPPSLYFSTTAGVSLNRKFPGHPDKAVKDDEQKLKKAEEHGDHVIVASEPSTYDRDAWELIGKNECIMVGRDLVVRREPIKYET